MKIFAVPFRSPFVTFFDTQQLKTKLLAQKMATNTVVGMMDSAYFVGRKVILDWLNELCQLNLTKYASFTISRN